MKINEIEKLSGLDRANIRFYEKEGLIKPLRLDNGYREYSPEDLALLLRIKLLRSLHISLAEIRALQSRDKKLSQVLASQLARLEAEKKDLAYAQELCQAIQKDQASFADLDAGKYLAGISTRPQASSSYFSLADDAVEQVFAPWPRFLARLLDILACRAIWSALLAFVLAVNLANRSNWGHLFDSYMALALLLLLEPLWLSLFGSTPGKLIFGLRIKNSAGGLLSYKEARQRTWCVVGAGLGYNIPVYNLVRLWQSYRLASELEVQPWDEKLSCSIKEQKWYRGLSYVAALAVVIFASVLVISSQLLPPHRGDLTIAQFVENHNYYARYLGLDFTDSYLAENGNWQEKAYTGTVYIDMISGARPDYHYGLTDGFVTDVSFAVATKNEDAWLGSYDNYKLLVSLALAGAQKETGLLSKIPSQLASQISANSFQSFSYAQDSFKIMAELDYAGYFDTQSGFLVPMENVSEQYFRLEFTAEKLNR